MSSAVARRSTPASRQGFRKFASRRESIARESIAPWLTDLKMPGALEALDGVLAARAAQPHHS